MSPLSKETTIYVWPDGFCCFKSEFNKAFFCGRTHIALCSREALNG